MKAIKSALIVVVATSALALLFACSTPPARMTDDDFVMRSLKIESPVAHLVSAFHDGFRYCGSLSGTGFFKVAHGVPDCGPPRPDGTAICDVYAGKSRDQSDLVLGRADFRPSQGGTLVVLKIQKWIADKEAILDTWEKFVLGRPEQACPAK